MSKVLRYSVTSLGVIEICGEENLTEQQIMGLIADDFNQWGGDIDYANDIEYEIIEA